MVKSFASRMQWPRHYILSCCSQLNSTPSVEDDIQILKYGEPELEAMLDIKWPATLQSPRPHFVTSSCIHVMHPRGMSRMLHCWLPLMLVPVVCHWDSYCKQVYPWFRTPCDTSQPLQKFSTVWARFTKSRGSAILGACAMLFQWSEYGHRRLFPVNVTRWRGFEFYPYLSNSATVRGWFISNQPCLFSCCVSHTIACLEWALGFVAPQILRHWQEIQSKPIWLVSAHISTCDVSCVCQEISISMAVRALFGDPSDMKRRFQISAPIAQLASCLYNCS